MTEILDPVWQQQLTKSLHVNSSQVQSKYYQVASVCSNGEPKNRTMVFRGFLSGTQSLLSVTDSRSEKIEEWQGDNKSRFEICWYFSESREQFRLAGEVALISNSLDSSYEDWVLGKHTKQSILKQQWSNLSTNAREPFYSNSPKAPFDEDSMPSMPQNRLVNKGADLKNKFDSNNTTPTNIVSNLTDMSDNFCVIIFIPHAVDYLDLKSKPQQRCLYAIQDDWKERPVNP
ncbi:pyridoxamine 5'-phosphate oxidase [Paraglaciecola sp.]|nr:pyridoxamine 5'-phosphate oxidase [Paraglaciecola sp.]